jgi:hypothetical protein
MKTIKKDELFRNLGDFLKSKGIELNDGNYTARVRQGCNLLSEAINATQKTVRTAKAQVDDTLEKLRRSVHEATAPKASGPASPKSPRPANRPKAGGRKQSSPRAKQPLATNKGPRRK